MSDEVVQFIFEGRWYSLSGEKYLESIPLLVFEQRKRMIMYDNFREYSHWKKAYKKLKEFIEEFNLA